MGRRMSHTDGATSQSGGLATLQLPELVVGLRSEGGLPKIVLHGVRGERTEVSGPRLYAAAECFAEALTQKDAHSAAIEMVPSLSAIAALLGCFLAGVVAVPIPPPLHGESRVRCHNILRVAQPDVIVFDNGAQPYEGGNAARFVSFYAAEGEANCPTIERKSELAAVVQFTSGSTTNPRGCVLTGRAIMSNLSLMQGQFELGGDDIAVGWLPLYHDMGLFGLLLLPLAIPGMSTHLYRTQSFSRNPASWLTALSLHRATISPAPASAVHVLSSMLETRRLDGIDLSAMRNLIIGAEPINPSMVNRFAEALARVGLKPEAIKPAYGMAEATLMVSMRHGIEVVARPASASGLGGEYTTLGAVSPSEVRIRPTDDVDASEGEVEIRVPSLMTGYLHAPGVIRTPFSADGWMQTGDIGFIVDGQLVVTGRASDRINVGGRKIHAIDIERFVTEFAKPRRVTVVAFAVRMRAWHSDRMVVVIEGRTADTRDGALVREVAVAVRRHFDSAPHDVVGVRRGTVLRTSSGKIRRSELRDRYLSIGLQRAAER